MNDDIQQERRVRQQYRTESLKALNDGISTRRYVCHWWGSYLSTTTKYHDDNMKCRTTLPTLMYQVPRIYYKGYLVPGTRYQEGKKTEKKKRKNEKMKNDSRTNMHAFKEQAESRGDKVAACW